MLVVCGRGLVLPKRCIRDIAVSVVLVAASLGGCAANQPELFGPLGAGPITGSTEASTTLPTSQKIVAAAQRKFTEGHYGLAVDDFSKAVEGDPLNPEAWLGLAASYDHVGRFDQADKAYAKVQDMLGATPSVLNNMGYSYLLRGNLERSRETLKAAYKGDPSNPYIRNNIDILNQKLAGLGQPTVELH